MRLNISGLGEEEWLVKKDVREAVERELEKLDKMMPVSDFEMHVRKYRKEGSRAKYSVHAKLLSGEWEFFAEESEWDIHKAVRGVLGKIGKEVLRKEDRLKFHAKK